MTLLLNFGLLGVGFIMLYFGAEWLVRGSSQLALKMGISPLVVGLTVVAFGTSAPELAVSIDAARAGDAGLALGNVIGSNICNLALVLGISALVKPLKIHRQVIKFDMPVLILVSGFFSFLLMNDGDEVKVSRLEGVLLTLGIIGYVAYSLVKSRKRVKNEKVVEVEGLDSTAITAAKNAGLGKILWFVVLVALGLVTLSFGSNYLIAGGGQIAEWLGVPKTIIGLSIIAFGTSVPELATSIVAAVRGHGDIISGNAVGSCIFNLLAVIGIASLVAPMACSDLSQINLYVMLGVTVIMLPFMASRSHISRLEGLTLTVGYIGYTVYLANSY